jgi:putative ABC transport system substrate-binding protein
LLKQAIPELSRVFLLYDAHSPEQLQATEVAAQSLGLELQSLELKNPPYDFDHAMGVAVRDRAQGLVVLSSPAFFRQRSQIVALTVKYRLPEIFLFRFFVEAGELMAYGANLFDMFRHGASYVDKILKGANPAELPVEQPTQFELVVNLKTAEALNLTLPPSILLQATEVIE